MESSLSLLMANLSKVQKNMLVIDPFVGTGKKAFILKKLVEKLGKNLFMYVKWKVKDFLLLFFFQEVS